MTKPACLVIGAGAGIGGNVAKRFAREGYHAVLARRSDRAGLDQLVDEIKSEGGSATGFMLNAVEEGSIERLVETVEADIGQKLGIIKVPGVYFLDLIFWKVKSDDHASADAPHNHRAPFCVHSPG